jgi:hypothetical protein
MITNSERLGKAWVKNGAAYFKRLLDQGDVTALANLAVAWDSIFCTPPPTLFSVKLILLFVAFLSVL